MQITHVTIGVAGRIGPFEDPERRHEAVRGLIRAGGEALALFNVLPDHAHLGRAGDAGDVLNWRRAASLSLRSAAGTAIERTFEKDVSEVNHARTLIRYILSQCAHHDVPHDDALWTGSVFQDLIGARWLDDWKPVVRALDARFRLRDALAAVGLPPNPIEPASPELINALGLTRLRSAAVVALLAPNALAGRSTEEVLARSAVIHLGREAGFQILDLERSLGVDRRTVLRTDAKACPDPVLLAVRTRLGLEEAVRVARMEQAWRALRATMGKSRDAALEG